MKEEADLTLNGNAPLYNNNYNNVHPAPAPQLIPVDVPVDIPYIAQFEGSGKRFTPEEDKRIWDYLLQQPYCHSERTWAQLGEEFHERYAPYRSNRSWSNRMKYVLGKINEADCDDVTKVNLLIKYDFQPQETFIIDISETMNLTLDSRGHIVDYTMKPVDRRSSLETSGPLIPSRVAVPIKNEPVDHEEREEEMEEEEEHEQDMKFSTAPNPYALGDHLPPDEDDYEVEEGADQEEEMDQTEEGDLAPLPQLQHMDQVVVEPPTLPIFEDVVGSHGVVQQQNEAPQHLYASYFDAMKKSIIEETNAAVRQTIEEIMKKGEKEKPKESEKVSLKQFLTDLKIVVANFESSHMDDIEERIDYALVELEVQDKMVPIEDIHVLLDLAVKMMGH